MPALLEFCANGPRRGRLHGGAVGARAGEARDGLALRADEGAAQHHARGGLFRDGGSATETGSAFAARTSQSVPIGARPGASVGCWRNRCARRGWIDGARARGANGGLETHRGSDGGHLDECGDGTGGRVVVRRTAGRRRASKRAVPESSERPRDWPNAIAIRDLPRRDVGCRRAEVSGKKEKRVDLFKKNVRLRTASLSRALPALLLNIVDDPRERLPRAYRVRRG